MFNEDQLLVLWWAPNWWVNWCSSHPNLIKYNSEILWSYSGNANFLCCVRKHSIIYNTYYNISMSEHIHLNVDNCTYKCVYTICYLHLFYIFVLYTSGKGPFLVPIDPLSCCGIFSAAIKHGGKICIDDFPNSTLILEDVPPFFQYIPMVFP